MNRLDRMRDINPRMISGSKRERRTAMFFVVLFWIVAVAQVEMATRLALAGTSTTYPLGLAIWNAGAGVAAAAMWSATYRSSYRRRPPNSGDPEPPNAPPETPQTN